MDDDYGAEPGFETGPQQPVCSSCGNPVKVDDSTSSDPFSTPFDYDRPDASALLNRSRRVAPIVWALFFLVAGAAGGYAYRYFEQRNDIENPRPEEPRPEPPPLREDLNGVFIEAASLSAAVVGSAFSFVLSSVSEHVPAPPVEPPPIVADLPHPVNPGQATELLVLSVRSQLHGAFERGVLEAEQAALALPPMPPEPLPERPFEVVAGCRWSAVAAARLREGNLEAVAAAIDQAALFVSLGDEWPTIVQLGRATELPSLINRQLRDLDCDRAGRLIRELEGISPNLAEGYDDSVEECEEELRLQQGRPPETLE